MKRIRRDTRSNPGLGHIVLLKMLENAEEELMREDLYEDKKRFILLCTVYVVVCFGASLRGCIGFHDGTIRHDCT